MGSRRYFFRFWGYQLWELEKQLYGIGVGGRAVCGCNEKKQRPLIMKGKDQLARGRLCFPAGPTVRVWKKELLLKATQIKKNQYGLMMLNLAPLIVTKILSVSSWDRESSETLHATIVIHASSCMPLFFHLSQKEHQS